MPKVRETFSRYDTADYLKTEEDIALYMEAVMEEGGDDANFIAHALGDVARARNMSQLARDTGMTREGLYKALSSEGNPSFATVLKVVRALGLELRFRKAAKRVVGTGART
jgi:probable addiction module antidote protein